MTRARVGGSSGGDDAQSVVPSDAASAGATSHVLIVDGDCAFCRASVRWLVARDTAGLLRVATRDSAFAQGVFARHPQLGTVDALLWVQVHPQQGESVMVRWRAVHAAAQVLRGWPRVLVQGLDRLLPLRVLDAGYALVAAVRRRLPGAASCRLPDAVEAARRLA